MATADGVGESPVEEKFTWTNERGVELSAYRFSPPASAGTPKGTLVYHHGLRDHIGTHTNWMVPFANAGWEVLSYDCERHGDSWRRSGAKESVLGTVCDVRRLAADLVAFTEAHVRARPVFCSGGSMGGMLAILAAERTGAELFAGIVLIAPAVGVPMTPVLRMQAAVAGLMVRVAPGLRIVPAAPPSDVTNHEADLQAMYDDPLVPTCTIDVRTGHAMLQGFGAVAAAKHKLQVPMALIMGDDDRVCSLEDAKKFVDRDWGVKTYEIPGGQHKLVNSTLHREACVGHMQEFMDWVCSGKADKPSSNTTP